MVQIEFQYLQINMVIQANLDSRFEIAARQFATKAQLQANNLSFLYEGRALEMTDIINNIINDFDRQRNQMQILVYSLNSTIHKKAENNSDNRVKPQIHGVICPLCKEPCFFEIKDYRIKLYGCKNGHKMENIKLNEYIEYQKVDISKIICHECKSKNKGNTFNNEFYKCLKCNKNLCPLCKSYHDNTHNIVNYDLRNSICLRHNKEFIEYCVKCKMDLCPLCEKEHREQNGCYFLTFFGNYQGIRFKLDQLRVSMNKMNENIKETIKKLGKVMENMERFYNVVNNILLDVEENKMKNYYQKNILKIIIPIIDEELNNIRSKYKYGYNLDQLLYIYNDMEEENISIEMNYTLDLNNFMQNNFMPNTMGMNNIPMELYNQMDTKIRIFGHNFVEHNKDKCKMIMINEINPMWHIEIEKKEYEKELNEYFQFDSLAQPGIIKFKLKGINNITDMSYMFYNCELISVLPDISIWDTSKVINMNNMFGGCKSLSYLPDISKWDTSNVLDMSGMFSGCNMLSSLPDISKWNISKVNDMNGIFNGCCKIFSLPDISKWNTSNVITMKSVFSACISLSSLPDISKWNTSNVQDMSFMFSQCYSLKTLPDISKWNTSSLSYKNGMFHQCNCKHPVKFS